jgi:hypothetical protein
MNFMTFNAAYSLYPCATFHLAQNLVLRDDSDGDQRCLVKYAKRGWKTIANYWPQDQSTSDVFIINVHRFMGDNHCWILPFSMEGVETPPPLSTTSNIFHWDPIVHNSWTLTFSTMEPWKATAKYCVVKTPAFRFAYLCVPDRISDALTLFGKEQGNSQWKDLQEQPLHGPLPPYWQWYMSTLCHQNCIDV